MLAPRADGRRSRSTPTASSCSPGTSPIAGSGSSADDYERLPRGGAPRVPPRRDLRPRRSARARPAGQRRRHRQRARPLPRRRAPRAPLLRQHRVRGRHPDRDRLRARARDGPGVQEPLRVDEVPGRGLGPRAARPGPDDDPAARRSWSATRAPGETQKFDGPYYILRAIARARALGRPMPQFGRSEAPFNVVPVDYVVAAMPAAADDPATLGQTLHLVDPDPLTAPRAGRAALARLHGPRAPRPGARRAGRALAARARRCASSSSGIPSESIAYLNHPVAFDARRTVDLLAPARSGAAEVRASTPRRWSTSSARTRTTRRSSPLEPHDCLTAERHLLLRRQSRRPTTPDELDAARHPRPDGRTAVVTGANGGLGLETAKALAAPGPTW